MSIKEYSACIAGCWRRAGYRWFRNYPPTENSMRFSLINPAWSFENSIYFGCREPHLPLEYGYARILLERAGHEVQIVDGQLEQLTTEDIRDRVSRFKPDFS